MSIGTVCALAGRRIDAAGQAESRFPLSRREDVSRRIRNFLVGQGVRVLVCSAACGADLLALEQAGELGLRRRVVLPFDASKFRETSVIDRPGDWGPLYDAVLAEVQQAGDLVVLGAVCSDTDAYEAANEAMLVEVSRLCDQDGRESLAVAVWEGASRGGGDATASFLAKAEAKGIATREIMTL